jgi:hypothetical protein
MAAIAGWMQLHGATIHGTTASRFEKPKGFLSTTGGRRQLHLFVLEWKAGPLRLPGLVTVPNRATLHGVRGAAAQLAVESGPDGVQVVLPATPPPGLLPVITLGFAADVVVNGKAG